MELKMRRRLNGQKAGKGTVRVFKGKKLGALDLQGLRKCGKQDLNLQVRIAHMNLNHARLPIPPFPHGMCGQGWIRTTEACRGRFTVCSLWPLGNLPILFSLIQEMELAMGLEPATC